MIGAINELAGMTPYATSQVDVLQGTAPWTEIEIIYHACSLVNKKLHFMHVKLKMLAAKEEDVTWCNTGYTLLSEVFFFLDKGILN